MSRSTIKSHSSQPHFSFSHESYIKKSFDLYKILPRNTRNSRNHVTPVLACERCTSLPRRPSRRLLPGSWISATLYVAEPPLITPGHPSTGLSRSSGDAARGYRETICTMDLNAASVYRTRYPVLAKPKLRPILILWPSPLATLYGHRLMNLEDIFEILRSTLFI